MQLSPWLLRIKRMMRVYFLECRYPLHLGLSHSSEIEVSILDTRSLQDLVLVHSLTTPEQLCLLRTKNICMSTLRYSLKASRRFTVWLILSYQSKLDRNKHLRIWSTRGTLLSLQSWYWEFWLCTLGVEHHIAIYLRQANCGSRELFEAIVHLSFYIQQEMMRNFTHRTLWMCKA